MYFKIIFISALIWYQILMNSARHTSKTSTKSSTSLRNLQMSTDATTMTPKNLNFSACRSSISVKCKDQPGSSAKGNDGKGESEAEEKKIMKPSEIPIYCDTCQTCKPKDSLMRCQSLEEVFSVLRKGVSDVKEEYDHVEKQVKENLETFTSWVSENTRSALDTLHQEDKQNLRSGVIGVSALAGIAGAGGGKIQRLVGGLVLGGAAAAVCYPEEGVEFAKVAWKTYEDYCSSDEGGD